MVFSLFLAASKADAGTYYWTTTDPNTGKITAQSPAYSGGIYIAPGPQGPATPNPYKLTNNGYGGASGGAAPPSCTGTINTTFTWQPAAGQTMTTDPPPAAVVVMETCTASATPNQPGSSGSCSTGMGHSGSVTYTPGGGNNTVTVTDVRYTGPGGGATVTLPPVTPSATATTVGATSSVYYTAAISPVFVNLAGTTPDSSNNLNILVGQGCTSSLSNTIPSALLNNTTNPPTYSWTVSGTTFQDWEPTTPAMPNATPPTAANLNASYFVPGYGPANQATAHWFWNDPGSNPTPETVTCAVTLTPPAGQGSTFTVTPTQNVTVQVPGWTATGIGGYMQVNAGAPGQNGSYALWAGPNAGQPGGMSWTANCTTPQTPVAFGTGTLDLVQIVTPNESYIADPPPGVVHNDPENGQNGLDTGYPYPGPAWTEGSVIAPYKTNDNPSIGLNNSTRSATMTHQFTDYLMYLPPNSGSGIRWVPRATFSWSTNGNATIPITSDWADYMAQNGSDSAGTVTPNTTTPFTAGNTFPSWTRINVFPSF